MDKTQLENFNSILNLEDNLISEISIIQRNIHDAVLTKSWDSLVILINNMNQATDDFEKIDTERDSIQNKMTPSEVRLFSKKLLLLRSKLAQQKVENRALNDYISITRCFIGGVMDKATVKTYSRYGQIIQKQPVSVLVSATC